MAIKTITAKFDGVCPQCKEPMKTGTEIGCTHDKVWRCMRCTQMFEELGPTKSRNGERVYYLTAEDAEKDNARRTAIVEKYGMAHTFKMEVK